MAKANRALIGPQCPSGFQLPDGSRMYCQHPDREGHRGKHRIGRTHPVEWNGTAAEQGTHCGYEGCPGGSKPKLFSQPGVQVQNFDPDKNDATKEPTQ